MGAGVRTDIRVARSSEIPNTFAALTGKRVVPWRIEQAYKMREISEYRAFFSCDVLFNKDSNRIILSKNDTSTAILTNDQGARLQLNEMIHCILLQSPLMRLFVFRRIHFPAATVKQQKPVIFIMRNCLPFKDSVVQQ